MKDFLNSIWGGLTEGEGKKKQSRWVETDASNVTDRVINLSFIQTLKQELASHGTLSSLAIGLNEKEFQLFVPKIKRTIYFIIFVVEDEDSKKYIYSLVPTESKFMATYTMNVSTSATIPEFMEILNTAEQKYM